MSLQNPFRGRSVRSDHLTHRRALISAPLAGWNAVKSSSASTPAQKSVNCLPLGVRDSNSRQLEHMREIAGAGSRLSVSSWNSRIAACFGVSPGSTLPDSVVQPPLCSPSRMLCCGEGCCAVCHPCVCVSTT